MGYIYKYLISGIKYLDHLSTYINNIIVNDGMVYEENELSILFATEPGSDIITQLDSLLSNYIPPQIYSPPIDFPEVISNLSAISSTVNNINTTNISTASLIIFNTSNSYGLGSSSSLIVHGTSSFLDNVFLGKTLDLNYNHIINVTTPSTLLDVANKYYVDNRFDNFTVGNVNGNFTQGQVIIAGTGGNILGYDTFTFNTNGMLSILTTNNASNLTSGGALTIYGGASFNKNVYIGTGLDLNNTIITSVALPINPTDAVNKEYVDYFSGVNPGDIRETSFVLNNNINTPTNVVGFSFLNTEVSSFEAIVYLQIPELNIYDQWEIHGVLKGSTWIINTTFIGDRNNKISFSIINTGTTGQIQYINTNNSGTATIIFRATTTSQGIYTNTTIGNNLRSVLYGGTGTDFFTQGTLLIGDGINSIKTNSNLMYTNNTLLLNNTNVATNLTTATVIFSGGVSIQKNLLIGTGIDVNMQKITNLAIPTNLYDAANKFYVDSVFSSGGSLNLNGPVSFYNTEDATGITHGGSLTVYGGTAIGKKLYVGGISHFINTTSSVSTSTGSVIIYGGLGITGNINGINSIFTNITSSNTNFINTITTNITSSNTNFVNTITTNITSSNTNFINTITTNITSSNTNFINTTTTNITSSNINTTNITSSNLNIINTITTNVTSSNTNFINTNTTNITSSNAVINTVNMTPSLGDIFKEMSFNASDNVITPDSITGLVFNSNVRYFTAWLSVFITTSSTNLVTAFTIEGLQINSGVWDINYRFIGTNTKIKLYITNSGQIQYTCPGIPGFVSSLMKFRSITTSV
jgi:trimeric autotransporter adhesin